MKEDRAEKGFTLLEILVALAFLSIALVAGLKTSGTAVRNATGLKERTLAHWVTANRAAELELDSDWLPLGTSHGKVLMADHLWYWTVRTKKTPDPDIRQAEVSAGLEEKGEALAVMEIYLARP
jgi:general secretion pathway protein I